VVLTGCGGSKHSSAATSSVSAPTSAAGSTESETAASPSAISSGAAASADPATTTAITTAFTTLFDGGAPLAQRLTYLQNSAAFEPALKTQSSNPILKETSASVTGVNLQSPTQARVLFTVSLSGAPLLKGQTGIALKGSGGWQVAATSLCALLSQEGQTPAVCTQASTTALPS
jgi:hypothetical protein